MQRNNRKNMTYLFDIKLRTVKMYLEEGIVNIGGIYSLFGLFHEE